MQPTSRIQHIDSWRFVAIALVLVSHLLAFSHPWYRELFLPIIWPIQKLGTLGVQIFFCISGYVICRGLIKEHQSTGTVSIKAFYVRRLLRIVPPVLVYMLALYLVMQTGIISVDPGHFVRAGLFVCNFDRASCGWFLGHTWSLAYEEQFYLFFPVIFMVCAAAGARAGVVALTVSVMLLSLLARYFALDLAAEYAATFVYMLTGCAAAMYWDEVQAALKKMPFTLWLALMLMTLALTCVVPLPAPVRHVYGTVIAPLAICAFVLGTPVSVPQVGKLFLHPTVAHWGKVSFTIYLWQQLATAYYPGTTPLMPVLLVAAVLLVALASYRWLELPLIRLGHRYSSAVGGPAAGAAPAPATPVPK